MTSSRNIPLAPVALALLVALATACQPQGDAPATPEAAPPTPASPPPDPIPSPALTAAPTATAVAYDCGGTAVQATFDGGNATLVIDGEAIPLATVPSASGARYQGARADGVPVELWAKGDRLTLSVAGNAYPECATAGAGRDAGAAAAPGSVYRARGNEPFWSIEVAGETLRWTTPATPEGLEWVGVTRTDRDDGFDLVATRGGDTLSVAATTSICRDSMSGLPHPHTVTLRLGAQSHDGCGGEPRDLLVAHPWAVSSVAGVAVEEGAPTLQFAADDRASGFAGCNRWMAAVRLTGEGLAIERPASTMMACPEAAMAREQAFLGALAQVTRHDFDERGDLLLKAGDTTVIVASPVTSAP